ncbi:hypothetical protein L1887_02898 [Cichorium endivia]|nr:hypothetical protein L1887_02898 [Cichorium endivia]
MWVGVIGAAKLNKLHRPSKKPSPEHKYSKIGALSIDLIPPAKLLESVKIAAKTGAEVVMEVVNKPRNISYKGITDVVLAAILATL